jgi:hypothetical protein
MPPSTALVPVRLPISRLHYNSGNLQGRMAGNVPEGSV